MPKFVYKCFTSLIHIPYNLREELNTILGHADLKLKVLTTCANMDRERRKGKGVGFCLLCFETVPFG